MTKRIFLCLVCVLAACLTYPSHSVRAIGTVVSCCSIIGIFAAWVLVFARRYRYRYQLDVLHNTFDDVASRLEMVLVVCTVLNVILNDRLLILIDTNLMLGFLLGYPIMMPRPNAKLRKNLRILSRLNKPQREYIAANSVRILRRELSTDLHEELSAFLSAGNLVQNHEMHPNLDPFMMEFTRKALSFWNDHQNLKYYQKRVLREKNPSEKERLEQESQHDHRYFILKWNTEPLAE